jgi:serine/threonine-protein kinase
MGDARAPKGTTAEDCDDRSLHHFAPSICQRVERADLALDPDATSDPSPGETDRLSLEFDPSTPADQHHLAERSAGFDAESEPDRAEAPTRPPGDSEKSSLPGTETGSYLPSDPSAASPWEGQPSTDPAYDVERRPDDGPQIAGYTILGVLGRGGMGLVYRAHHLALDRTVALKVILGGEHAGGEQRARFLTEAQAAAHLLHPNVIQIYEIGQTEGLPYFSLEYVDGGSLEQRVNRQPQNPQWSAALVETIARAMDAAHRRSIIHRDLKPSNVLLTQEGVPKITDFGLAKRLETDSGQTRTGSIMGTPTYMAPEQAWGRNTEVGPRSDIYSIGAILYTLLTGRPPFQGTSPLETLEQVRTQEPVSPSRLQPKLHRDLETICLKCLQKEPPKRYETAEALADDLRRFLNGDTILARPVSAPERLWRLARRNKRVAFLTASVLFLLVAVAVIATTYAAILSGKNEALRVASEKEQAAHAKSTRLQLEAEASVKQAFQQNRSALEAWRTLGRLTIEDLKAIPAAQHLRQRFLDEVLQGLRNTADGMEPLYQVYRRVENAQMADFAMAGVHKMLGDELLDLGQMKDAREHYRRMDAIAEQAAASAPGNLDLEYQLANSRSVLGDFNLMVIGDAKAALSNLEDALKLRRHRLEVEPDNDDAKLRVANALGQLAMCHQRMGEVGAAKALFQEELEVRESLSEQAKGAFETRRELSGLYDQLGRLSLELGNVPDGRKNYERAYNIRKALAAEKPGHLPNLRDLSRSLNSLGELCLVVQNDPASARTYYEKALDAFRKIHAVEPTTTHKADISFGCYFLATALLRLGEKDKAQALYRECLDIRRTLAKGPEAKVSQINLAIALARCGEHAEAAQIARKLLSSPENSMVFIEVACVFALCAGATPEAALQRTYTGETLAAIRKGFADGWRDLERLRVDPDLDPVRGDPAFQQMLQEFQQPPKSPAAGS